MPVPLTNEWIEEQLQMCATIAEHPLWRYPSWQLLSSDFLAAAWKGYPLVLKEVMRLRGLLVEQNAEAECVSCGEMFPQSELVDEMCDSCRSYSGTDC